MDPTSWKHAFDLYDTYGDLPINDFMTRINNLPVDPEVRDILVQLKTSEKDSSDYFDSLGEKISDMVKPATPKKLGEWKVLGLIDTGGMSSVYHVERNDEAFSMKAAAKLIHFGGYNPRILKRFKREIEFLTLLDHPNITRIIDWGVHEEGLPWCIMEYVEGMPITQYCHENQLSLEFRLKLFRKVCDAVQHAHRNLVIHRDLKPSNIFVDTKGEVKLLDFGIAKAISQAPSDLKDHILTHDNQALMTPVYAAPEQLGSEPVSTASDVYSLGIILHELVTGRRPYTFEEVNPLKMLSFMNETTLEKPSETFRKSDPKPAGIKKTRLSTELDDIILTALRIEPDRRYASAEQLGRDIQAFLDNEPVLARPDSRRYRFRKFVQRNTAAVTAAAATLLILISAAVVVFWQAEQTRIQAERTVAVKDFLVTMVSASNPFIGPGETPTVRDMLEHGSRNVELELSDQPVLAAEMFGVIGASYGGLGEPQRAREYLEKSLDLAAKHRGLDPVTEAEIRATHAISVLGTGDAEQARELSRKLLEDIKDLRGAERVRGNQLNLIAATYYVMAEYDKALEYAYEAREVICGTFGELSTNCISPTLELKYFYEGVGKYDEALETSERAWRLASEYYADEPHPTLVMAAGAYGDALSLFARTDESIPILKENVEHSLRIYGDENFRYARGMHWLASAYQRAGRTHDELELMQKLIPIGEAAVPRNPLTVSWMFHEVQAAIDLRKPEIGRASLDAREDRLPDNYPPHIRKAFRVQDMQIRYMQGESAASIQQQALALVEELKEEGSTWLNRTRVAAAFFSIQAGDTETSGRLLEDAGSLRSQSNNSDTTPIRYFNTQARHFLAANDTEAAIKASENAAEILETARHSDGPFLAEHRAIMAEIACRNGNTAEGRALLESSLQYWQETAGSELGAAEMRQLAGACG